MRVTREQAAANRERIIETAGELFRSKGFSGIGVADIMKAADLTHGGFFGQPQVRARLIVVERIQSQDPSQMPFAID